MIDRIHWLGHATFKITDGKVIYIDPFKLKDDAEPADLILITHDHFDHLSADDLKKIVTPATKFVGPPSVAKALKGDVTVIRRGERVTVDGYEIEAVSAYNIGKDFHPKQTDNVAYVVTVEGTRIYHAGDTDAIPEHEQVRADIALLPCGGTYTMTAKEAAEAAARIKPTIAVPMHWGSIVGSRADAEEFARLCTTCEVRILEPE